MISPASILPHSIVGHDKLGYWRLSNCAENRSKGAGRSRTDQKAPEITRTSPLGWEENRDMPELVVDKMERNNRRVRLPDLPPMGISGEAVVPDSERKRVWPWVPFSPKRADRL